MRVLKASTVWGDVLALRVLYDSDISSEFRKVQNNDNRIEILKLIQES